MNNPFSLNHKPLFKQKALLLTLIPLILSIYLFFDNYSFSSSGNWQDKIIEQCKLSLIVLASFPFLIGLIVNAHRSVQTNYQIERSESKNKVDLYLAHYKHYIEIFNNSPTYESHTISGMKVKMEIVNKNNMYTSLFKKNSLKRGLVNELPVSVYDDFVSFVNDVFKIHFSNDFFDLIYKMIKSNDFSFISHGRLRDVEIQKKVGMQRDFTPNSIIHYCYGYLLSHGVSVNLTRDGYDVDILNSREIMTNKDLVYVIFSSWFKFNEAIGSDFECIYEGNGFKRISMVDCFSGFYKCSIENSK